MSIGLRGNENTPNYISMMGYYLNAVGISRNLQELGVEVRQGTKGGTLGYIGHTPPFWMPDSSSRKLGNVAKVLDRSVMGRVWCPEWGEDNVQYFSAAPLFWLHHFLPALPPHLV